MTEDWRLFMRRLVEVLDWFDEDHDVPWNYVERTGDGRFQAVACYLLDGMDEYEGKPCDKLKEHVVGVFATEEAAIKALREHVRRVDVIEGLSSLNKALDFITVH